MEGWKTHISLVHRDALGVFWWSGHFNALIHICFDCGTVIVLREIIRVLGDQMLLQIEYLPAGRLCEERISEEASQLQ